MASGIKPLSDLRSDKLRRLLDLWHSGKPADGLPTREGFGPEDLRWLLGEIVLVDVERNPLRFRHRLFGTKRAEDLGVDMTGKYLDELPKSEVRATIQPTYEAVAKSGRPLCVERFELAGGHLLNYECLCLPLSNGGTEADMLLIGFERIAKAPETSHFRSVEIVSEKTRCEDGRLARLLTDWRAAAPPGGFPGYDFVDPVKLRYLIGCIGVLDVALGPEPQFIYRLVGTEITDRIGVELTGKPLSALPNAAMARDYQLILGFCVELKTGVHMFIERPVDGEMVRAEVLILPLAGADGNIGRLVGGQIDPKNAPRWRRPAADMAKPAQAAPPRPASQ